MDHESLQRIDDWLIDQGLAAASPAALLEGFCARLADAGMPLVRGAVGAETFHPVIAAQGFMWRPGRGAEREDYARAAPYQGDSTWRTSPFFWMIETGTVEVRRRLVGPGYRPEEFPLLAQFRAEGGTDYLALAAWFGADATLGALGGAMTSWIVDRPDGFRDDEIDALRRLVPRFALAYKAMATVDAGRTLVTTYLGRDAGERVLDGAIGRGEAEVRRTVLWFSDLRGFTRIGDTTPRAALIALLNDYCDAFAGAIRDQGGEVLKFIGDGILATFPADDEVAGCRAALDAAAAARTAIETLSARRQGAGQPATDFYLALHLGEVAYGNVGALDRLDFTVVGPAVNEAARIEAMCRALDQQILVSAAFAAASAEGHRLVSVGRYALRGVRRPQELFTLDPEA